MVCSTLCSLKKCLVQFSIGYFKGRFVLTQVLHYLYTWELNWTGLLAYFTPKEGREERRSRFKRTEKSLKICGARFKTRWIMERGSQLLRTRKKLKLHQHKHLPFKETQCSEDGKKLCNNRVFPGI